MQAATPRRTVALFLAFTLLLMACRTVPGQEVVADRELPQPSPTSAVATATPTQTLTPSPPTPVPSPTLALLSGRASLGDPFTPDLGNTGYDVQHYDLKIAVDPAAQMVTGQVTIEATTTISNLHQISLDFAGYEIQALTVNDEPATPRREGHKLWLELPRPLLVPGSALTITVGYAGQPLVEDSPYIHYADYIGLIFPGNNTFYTLNEPDGARYWFPCNDHPLDKATYRTELTVPRGLAGIANGRLVNSWLSNMPDGSAGSTFLWEHNYPMATYLALVAGGHYLRVEDESPNGIPLVYYYFPEFEEEYLEAVAVTGEAIDWMSEQFGPYPFDSYGQATYYALGISMEMQAMTLLSYQMLNERTVVHELAHSWFGNWVGLESWGDTWRKEGFATYMELLWLSRNDPAEMDRLLAEVEADVAERARDYPLNRPPQERVLSFDSYYRGALLMRALHEEVGDEAFFTGLRAFFTRYGGGTASQEEFQLVMEQAAGFSLDPFFDRWLAEPAPAAPPTEQ